MIERIVIENFKSLKQVNLKLGPLNLFIGANASGKSNFFDVLRVLRGLAAGFPLKDLFEGGAGTVTGETWPGIRGGLSHALYKGEGHAPATASPQAEIKVEFSAPLGKTQYAVGFNAAGAIISERLWRDGQEIFLFDGRDAHFRLGGGRLSACYPNPLAGSQIILAFRTGLAGEHKDFVETWIRELLSIQFLELDPDVLRRYGTAADIPRMGERGENFASLVRHICADEKTKAAYLSWLQELRPHEVDNVGTLSGAVGEPLFMLREGGREFPAPVLSDGTLRFAAIAAALFQPDMPAVMAIEEIENGVHASRLRLLVELLRSRASQGATQVMATTHSPIVLAWLKSEEYAQTFFCKREGTSGESRISPLNDFADTIRKHSISDLLAEGWLEAAL